MNAFCRRSEPGFILVTVLFISMLVLGAATSFAWYARNQMRRVADEEFALKATSVATIALSMVSAWIGGDDNDFDSVRELIYSESLPILLPFGEWEVIIGIAPQDRLLPINSLFLPDGVTVRNELQYAWEKLWDEYGDVEIGTLILDFLDRDEEARAGSRENENFANRLGISDLSELLYIEEIDPRILYGDPPGSIALDRFLSVYCGDKININVAPPEILRLLAPELTEDKVESILAYRRQSDIANEKDLVKIPGFPRAVTTRLSGLIGYKSEYFTVKMKVLYRNRERNYVVTLKRAGVACQIINWRE